MIDRLDGLHPDLIRDYRVIEEALRREGFALVVVQGVRTAEYQHWLYQQGRERPGPIVTNCDGYHTVSAHQPRADGFGHALDCAFVVEGKPSWAPTLPWARYGALAEAQGLVWGGHFRLVDLGHVELP